MTFPGLGQGLIDHIVFLQTREHRAFPNTFVAALFEKKKKRGVKKECVVLQVILEAPDIREASFS